MDQNGVSIDSIDFNTQKVFDGGAMDGHSWAEYYYIRMIDVSICVFHQQLHHVK